MKIDYDGLSFNTYEPDENGVFWYVQGLDGWDSPDLKTSTTDTTTRHGMALGKSLLNARAMTLTGLVKAPDLDTYYAARAYFQGKTNNLFQPKPFTVSEDIDKVCSVVRAGSLKFTPAGMCAFAFELPMTAYDPMKYAVTPTVVTFAAGASKTISNPGNFVSEKWSIKASAEGHVVLVNTAWGPRGVQTDQMVEAGTVFDGLKRTVTTPDGYPNYSSLAPVSTWWGLQPGDNPLINKSQNGLTFTYYPAWL